MDGSIAPTHEQIRIDTQITQVFEDHEGGLWVIPYSAGYFSIGDMAKAGTVMTVAAGVCVSIAVLGVGALIGPP